MAVRAVLKDGRGSPRLAASLGATPVEVLNSLVNDLGSLTGSGDEGSHIWLETEDGSTIRYSDVRSFELDLSEELP